MQLDLNSVDSIVAWWQVWPERYDSYLDYKLAASPEFAHSILGARRIIDARPELRALKPPAPAGWHLPQAAWAEECPHDDAIAVD